MGQISPDSMEFLPFAVTNDTLMIFFPRHISIPSPHRLLDASFFLKCYERITVEAQRVDAWLPTQVSSLSTMARLCERLCSVF